LTNLGRKTVYKTK